ncbi:hypothetical protein ASF46_13335 [Rathayibacter sp. Leaf296]|nr:hypothetical protein ASF46_13335 [Rathayibacter sp. Leaf296]
MLAVAETVEIGPLHLPLLGRSNVWIEDSIVDRSSIELTQAVVKQALERTRPGQLEVLVFDDALTGLSAPFAPVNSGGQKLMQLVSDQREFADALGSLRTHIEGVNNVMQGRSADLVDFRRTVGYPVEGFKLVVVSTDVSLLPDEVLNTLTVLLRAGPRAGVSFVVHSMTLGANPFLVGLCEHCTVDRVRALSPGRRWSAPTAQEIVEASIATARTLATAATDPIRFSDIQSGERTWTESSADGVTFAVGRYGSSTVEVTIGDELDQRHNVLITGAVGQGKSNLLSVMIHSLCQRYSPDELELYLLDFKEGVNLQQFVDEKTGEYLPHVRVLGLDADRAFGASTLRHLFELYRERMRVFKASGVMNIKEYRSLSSGGRMPRVLLVIDEFQMMFGDRDSESDETASLLIRAVRLFRACGIHIVLASQTIGGTPQLMGSAGDGLFGQIPIRLALKNSVGESHATLGMRNDAAAHLRAREAIVNLDYGAPSANRKTSIAHAAESVLRPMRRRWWDLGRERHPAPFVFDGERRRSILEDLDAVSALRAARGPASVVLGPRVDVGGEPVVLPFGREVGRNVAVLGTGEARSILGSIVLALAAQSPGARIVLLDLIEDAEWRETRDALVAAWEALGCTMEVVPRAGVADAVLAIAADLDADRTSDRTTFVVGIGLERCRSLPSEFQEICRSGPAAGIHVVGGWSKFDAFRDQIGYGGEAHFDVRIAARLDSTSMKQFFGDPLLEHRQRANRALVWDASEMAQPAVFIPYSLLDADGAAAFAHDDRSTAWH